MGLDVLSQSVKGREYPTLALLAQFHDLSSQWFPSKVKGREDLSHTSPVFLLLVPEIPSLNDLQWGVWGEGRGGSDRSH